MPQKNNEPQDRSDEDKAIVEEFMWQMKGDQHNICGEYNPTFCDKQEKRLVTLISHLHQSEAQKREEVVKAERERLFEEIRDFTFKAQPYEGTMIRVWLNNYKPDIISREATQSELDQPTECEHEWGACPAVMCTSDLHNQHCLKCNKHRFVNPLTLPVNK